MVYTYKLTPRRPRSGTVTLPLFAASYSTDHEVGAVGKSFLLYISTFGPHCSETP